MQSLLLCLSVQFFRLSCTSYGCPKSRKTFLTSDLYSIFPLVLYDSNTHTLSSCQSQLCSVVSVTLSSLNSLYIHFHFQQGCFCSAHHFSELLFSIEKRLCLFQSPFSLSTSVPLRKCSFNHLIRPCPLIWQTLIVT